MLAAAREAVIAWAPEGRAGGKASSPGEVFLRTASDPRAADHAAPEGPMYRIRFLFLLLPLLAGCATTHTAPNLAAALIPTLPYAPALDGGTVTPIQSPVVVKYAPYPTASFERLMRATGRGTAEAVSLSSRMTGTTFAKSRGDLVELTFEVADVTTRPDLRRDEINSLLPKGAKITLLLEPFGSVRNVSVSLPTSSDNHTTPEAIEKKLRQEFSGAN